MWRGDAGVIPKSLADPGLIGVTGGASLAAVAVIVLGGSYFSVVYQWLGPYALMVAAFAGAFLTTLIVARIATTRYGTSITTMLLAGIAIGIVTGAGVGVMTYMADDAQLRTLTFWSMGSLGGATWETVIAAGVLITVTLVGLPMQAKNLNALLLGSRKPGISACALKR